MLVWIASYPRSGNTLLRLILFHAFGLKTHSLYDDLADVGPDSRFAETVGHAALPPGWSPEKARRDDALWLVKTHDAPCDSEKAIYIIRDGRESVLSYLKYRQSFGGEEIRLADVIKGRVGFGSWSGHIRAWDPRNRPNTLLLRFEDLASDPAACLPAIGDFLGCPPMQGRIPSFGELHRVHPAFFRSGRTDSWREAFREEEHLFFWHLHAPAMLEYGYRSQMPEFLAEKLEKEAGELVRKEACIQEKEACIQKQAREIARCQARIAQLTAQRADLKNTLRAMRASRSWKWTRLVRSIERHFLPGDCVK